MTAAVWTTVRTEVLTVSQGDGSFSASVPLYDNGVKRLTLTFTVGTDRSVRVDVHGEAGAVLTGFAAWSDL